MKTITLILCIVSIGSIQTRDIHDIIAEIKPLVTGLEAEKDRIQYSSLTTYRKNGDLTTITETHTYLFPNREAFNKFSAYKNLNDELVSETTGIACGNGFTIGILTALMNKFCYPKNFLYPCTTLLIASLLATLKSNRSWGKLPYVDIYNGLAKGNNYFGVCNSSLRFLLTATNTFIGYAGATYTLNKIHSWVNHCKKKVWKPANESTIPDAIS